MEDQSLSLSVRLRRTTTETTCVSVPITNELTRPGDEGSVRKIDVDKVIKAALRLGDQAALGWQLEGQPQISLHPVQNAPDKGAETTQ